MAEETNGVLRGQEKAQAVMDMGTKEPTEDVKQVVSAGMRLIHSEKTRDQVLNMLSSADPNNPPGAIAKTALNIMDQLEGQASKSGIEVTDEAKLAASSVIIGQLVEVGEAAKLFDVDDDQVKKAAAQAVSTYINEAVKSGKISQDEIVAMSDEFKKQAAIEKNPKSTQAPQSMQGMLKETV